jgi:multidrug resistance efflux pump
MVARTCAALLVQALLLCACAHQAAPSSASTPAPLRTVRVVRGGVQPVMTLSGIIAPFQNVTISSSIQEPADAVYVREGDYVRAGQTLAQLDTADLRANYNAAVRNAEDAGSRVAQTRDQGALSIQQGKSGLTSAQTQLAQAQQKLALAQVTLRRDRQLYAQGFLTRQLLDNDTTEYENDLQAVNSAQAAVQNAAATVRINGTSSGGLQQETVASALAAAASARAQAEQIAVQIDKATIASPVNGVIVNRNLNPGQYPGSAALFTVQQIDMVYAMLNASSDQVFLIHPGAAATVRIGTLHEQRVHGVVEAVLGQPQPGGTNFVVKVRVANPRRLLQSGMIATAEVALPNVYGAMIPATAFVDAAHDAVRTQATDGTTRVTTVRSVAEDGSHSIVQGLPANARVVIP